MKSGIYLIRNIVTNRVYVGKATNIQQRGYTHFSKLKLKRTCNKMVEDYDEYGRSSFQISVLEYCPIEDMHDREIYWINVFNSRDENKGYNIRQPISNKLSYKQWKKLNGTD